MQALRMSKGYVSPESEQVQDCAEILKTVSSLFCPLLRCRKAGSYMGWSSYKNEKPRIITKNGKFFDVAFESGHQVIFEYQNTDDTREILANPDGTFSLGGEKEGKNITSIQALREIFEELVTDVLNIVNHNGTYNVDESITHYRGPLRLLYISIRPQDFNLLVEQLILDILFDKYCAESPQMTLQQYSRSHIGERWYGLTDDKLIVDCVRKFVSATVNRQVKVMNSPKLRRDIEKLGVNPDKYFSYLTQVSTPFTNGKKQEICTKEKPVWDYIYYCGFNKLITSKQYARSFSKHDNYSHKVVADMFDIYDCFVDDVFMQETETDREYFMKSLEFYSLEIYKRIDFIYKLAVRLDIPNAPIIDKNHALVKRFHPEVVIHHNVQDGVDCFQTRHKYYRPMLMLEDLWQEEKRYEDPRYLNMLQKHHLVRAKAYELFKYHYKFTSSDYKDISNFLRDHYNVLDYHEPHKIWIQPDKKRKSEREARVVKALEINEALFGGNDRKHSS